tara:strand:+ start:355 stop:654 length:300 start_codon:yes stop_codon:yes gene_type:complete
MGEFNHRVEMQRKILAAEEMKDSIEAIHAHSLQSMWYETEETKQDFELGSVKDVTYMDGRIERTRADGSTYVILEGVTGEDLLDLVERKLADQGRELSV